MDTLPVCVESLVVKIYKFFYIYTVQVSELKEICDFADVEYQRLLQHGNSRFLSLLTGAYSPCMQGMHCIPSDLAKKENNNLN